MSLSSGTFNPAASEGNDPYAEDIMDRDMDLDSGFDAFDTAYEVAGPAPSVQPQLPEFMDIVAAQSTGVDKAEPQQPQITPAQQAGIDLDAQLRVAEREIKPMPKVEVGVAFSRAGQGAERVDNEITRQEQIVNDLEAAVENYVALNPDKDPARVQPAEPQGGDRPGGIGFAVAGAALSAVVPPVMPAVRAAAQLFSPEAHGAGSIVTAFQTPQHSGSALDREAGYGAAPSSPQSQDLSMPAPAPAIPLDELEGTINHIVEPGLADMRPGQFQVEEIAQIQAACMDLRAHVQGARTAYNAWERGPVQAKDWDDVKQFNPEDLELKNPELVMAGNTQPIIAVPRI